MWLKAEAESSPCALCGQLHRLRIHGLLARKIRSGEEENSEILIVSIYCAQSRRNGRQYTRRILPPFVIRGCLITLENVLRYVSRHGGQEKIDYQEASYLLGTYDNRTIAKHINTARAMIRQASLEVLSRLSSPGVPAEEAPEAELTLGDWSRLESLLGAGSNAAGEPIVVIHAAYEKRSANLNSRGRRSDTSSCACEVAVTHDTS